LEGTVAGGACAGHDREDELELFQHNVEGQASARAGSEIGAYVGRRQHRGFAPIA